MKIYGHRGAPNEYPENTLASFKRAIELGADMIELDVYKISDGTLVVHHDELLGRCEEYSGYIRDMDIGGVKSITPNLGYGEDFSHVTIPTLDEVLEMVYDTDTGVNIEIKYQGINGVTDDVVLLLEKYRMRERCIISSFTKSYIIMLKEKYPYIKCGVIFEKPFDEKVWEYCKKYNIDAIFPHYKNVDAPMVNNCRKAGVEVYPWVVNTTADMEKMKSMGVTGIITDNLEEAVNYR